jgi:tRNA threonylcarbamoyladenosine biosynthesis protein TsaB
MILGFDTATRATSVALVGKDGLEIEQRDDPLPGNRPNHTSKLMALVVGVLDEAGVGWEAIERIAVGVGPGTFTGLRIGVATARAFAQAREIPLVGVSTLESLALAAAEHTDGSPTEVVVPALDARRGELFVAAWDAGAWGEQDGARPDPQPLMPPQALAPAEVTRMLGAVSRGVLAVGDGAVAFREVFERAAAVVPEPDSRLHKVSAISHCRLAAHLQGRPADEVHPEYLRLPDAEIARRRSATT